MVPSSEGCPKGGVGSIRQGRLCTLQFHPAKIRASLDTLLRPIKSYGNDQVHAMSTASVNLQARVDLIESAVDLLVDRIGAEGESEAARKFAYHYYQTVPDEDILALTREDLCGAVLTLFRYASERRAGEIKVRVYRPTLERDGWRSTHTVVELICDDSPFLVDSLCMVINRHGYSIHLQAHPVMGIERDEDGKLLDVVQQESPSGPGSLESIQHIEIDQETDEEVLCRLECEIEESMREVRAAVDDWSAMHALAVAISEDLQQRPPPLDPHQIEETRAFLDWLADDHFTFLGSCDYRLRQKNGVALLQPNREAALGILRNDNGQPCRPELLLKQEPPLANRTREPLLITKADCRSAVHRPAYMDYIAVRSFDERGSITGERRFLGLFTSAAYSRSPQEIPLLRQKVEEIMSRSGLHLSGHAGKALLHILETFPRDELFQSSTAELFRVSLGVLQLQERRKLKVFIRPDRLGCFFACLVYVPRDRHSTQLRERIEGILKEALQGDSVESTVQITESVLARVNSIVRVRGNTLPRFNLSQVEAAIAEAARSWEDDLREALIEKFGEEKGLVHFRTYRNRFSEAYKEDVSGAESVRDIVRIEALNKHRKRLQMHLYQPPGASSRQLRFKVLRRSRSIPIFRILPILNNFGLRVVSERFYEIPSGEGACIWIHDFELAHSLQRKLNLDVVQEDFQEAFAGVFAEQIEDDGFNRLVLAAGLNTRQTTLLRAVAKYLLQTGVPFSQASMERALGSYVKTAVTLVEFFEAKSDPKRSEKERIRLERGCRRVLERQVDAVSSLDDDRILRSFTHVIAAVLRTNYYQTGNGGGYKRYLSLKFDPKLIPDLPLPRPEYEVFVYSPRFEGVHLRGGKVARGGLRWSDRQEDFRTEILGLMKAQMIKNTLIVPVGAKGGFVVKKLPVSRDLNIIMAAVTDAYRNFLRGLLDITDNLSMSEVAPPADVVRHDGDDPYLVVAADKGTATFSDTANEVAAEYSLWLGDAFASGGSVGYDHKKMGITARGAWESVKRHFRELGTDVQNSDFTVVGIGDMSGDVFGNGMLLSPHLCLRAAFNHMHIFLDPEPDPKSSFNERERLFRMARSTWADYDTRLLSPGGGIHSRESKQIELSLAVRRMLGIKNSSLTPTDLIRSILRMRVDLLWNGGIGTYVKGKAESHADVGDRSNDHVRVNADELRCRVVGEGGNLGLTQRARIEFAQRRGHVNTDFVDNSGGVDCSDREVNIKVLLRLAADDGALSEDERRDLLFSMKDELAEMVLGNNYRQSQAISMMDTRAAERLSEHAYFIRRLEKSGHLDRPLEELPDDEEIAEREKASKGLTRPELAVLLAYSKIWLYNELLRSDVPEEPFFICDLEEFFPGPIQKRFKKYMAQHRLRREIIATAVTNTIAHRMGPTFAFRLQEETGFGAAEVARAFTAAREIFSIRQTWYAIEALDNKVAANLQLSMLFQTSRFLRHVTRWLLGVDEKCLIIEAAVKRYRSGVRSVEKIAPGLLSPLARKPYYGRLQQFLSAGVAEQVARRIACLPHLVSALNIVEVALAGGVDIAYAAKVYYHLDGKLSLDWIRQQIESLKVDGHWPAMARGTLRDYLFSLHRVIADQIVAHAAKQDPEDAVEAWLIRSGARYKHACQVFRDMRGAGANDFATLSVAVQEVRMLAGLAPS